MNTPRPPACDDDLGLPPLDGEDGEGEAAPLELDLSEDAGDALDDRTAEDEPLDDLAVDGEEGGWLAGSEEAGGVDVGSFDLSLSPEEKMLGEDEPQGAGSDEDLGFSEESVVADAGEEGPLADDEELREEDLPELDADEGGDVDDEALYDRSAFGGEDELRWDDRAWARIEEPVGHFDDADDSGALPVLGDDPALAARDAAWKAFDEGGRVMAVAFVPGGSVVLALEAPERPLLVRVLRDGAARIIAEIESDDEDPSVVTALRWDGARGWLIAAGTFGVQAFRPA